MDKVQRSVRLEYYKVVYRKKGDEEYNKTADADYDILDLIGYINNMSLEERKIKYYEDFARLEKIYDFKEKNALDKIGISFLRLRETGVPKITTLKEYAEDLDLKNDEYIGEDVSILYDSKLRVVVVQRNILSLSVSGIEQYLNHFLTEMSKQNGDGDIEIFFRPIVPLDIQEKIINAKYIRSINFRVAEFGDEKIKGAYTFNKLFKLRDNFNGSNVEVTVNVGRKIDRTLNKCEVKETIEEVEALNHELDGTITKARMKIKEDENTRVEEVDLFEDKLSDRILVFVERRKSLSSKYFADRMLETYKDAQGKIIESLSERD